MNILERKIVHAATTSFSHVGYPQLILPRHKHEEFELMLFTKGTGKQFVGDNVVEYKAGDMALIGSNIPHFHFCDALLSGEKVINSSGETLQFPLSIFPSAMEAIPDYEAIDLLLKRSQHGIRFYDEGLWQQVYDLVMDIDNHTGIKRIMQLYMILDILSKSRNYTLICETAYYADNSREDNNQPVNMVYTYLFNHFREKITLQQIADYVKQNPAALCRYFKKRTDKSIFHCLSEIRIEHACRLLSHSNLPVSQIAYECGFNNLSYFNRQFQSIVNYSPTAYRDRLGGIKL